jgi:hypothetical protein
MLAGGGATYNNGTPVGVNSVPQAGRAAEFQTAANGSNARTMQQSSPSGYRPSSVLNAGSVLGSGNGQSPMTYERTNQLKLIPQY